jgi:hypothetical protein
LDSAEPLAGYDQSSVLKKSGGATNDVYGALHKYVTDMIGQFCKRVNNMNVTFTLYDIDATTLPKTLANHGKAKSGFDRIEVGSHPYVAHKQDANHSIALEYS